jgi:hypothetical protein
MSSKIIVQWTIMYDGKKPAKASDKLSHLAFLASSLL